MRDLQRLGLPGVLIPGPALRPVDLARSGFPGSAVEVAGPLAGLRLSLTLLDPECVPGRGLPAPPSGPALTAPPAPHTLWAPSAGSGLPPWEAPRSTPPPPGPDPGPQVCGVLFRRGAHFLTEALGWRSQASSPIAGCWPWHWVQRESKALRLFFRGKAPGVASHV